MLVFLHGLESSPMGFKAQALRQVYPDLIAPLLDRDPWARLDQLQTSIPAGAVLVGSSLGGLSALMLAEAQPQNIKAMLLMAPAVGFSETRFRTPRLLALVNRLKVPQHIPTTIMLGLEDEVIPPASIEALVQRSPCPERIQMHRLQEGHRLNTPAAHELMLEIVANYMA